MSSYLIETRGSGSAWEGWVSVPTFADAIATFHVLLREKIGNAGTAGEEGIRILLCGPDGWPLANVPPMLTAEIRMGEWDHETSSARIVYCDHDRAPCVRSCPADHPCRPAGQQGAELLAGLAVSR